MYRSRKGRDSQTTPIKSILLIVNLFTNPKVYVLINTFSKVSAAVENYILQLLWKCLLMNREEWRTILGIYSININCIAIRLRLVSREIGYIHAVVTVGYHLRKCSYFQTKEAFIKNKSPIKRQLEVRR